MNTGTTEENDRLRVELGHVKAERDKEWEDNYQLMHDIDRLKSQLAAKDKVLESIKNAPAYTSRTWMREQASSILIQYAINESKPDTATTPLG